MKQYYTKIAVFIIVSGFSSRAFAQSADMGYNDQGADEIKAIRLSSGNNSLKIGVKIAGYFDARTYPAGATADKSKNTFKLKDARLNLKGDLGKDYEFKLQADFASWGSAYSPVGSILEDANFTYKGIRKLFNIKLGYGKVPYSLNSLVEHYVSPYWERPQVAKGDFFSRRDAGITLSRSFANDKVRAAAGMYTGTGENILNGSNDASGAFEYIGRVEASFPESHHEEIIDEQGLTTPNVAIGLNGRYSKRNLPAGKSFLPGETGNLVNGSDSAFNLKVVDGEKYILGGDISVLYRHFSAQFEAHALTARPQNSTNPLYNKIPADKNKGYVKAGGWYVQGNYFIQPAKTILSARYDEMNANDLVTGVTKHFAASAAYQLRRYSSMIKLQWDKGLQYNPASMKYGGEAINTAKWQNEFRLGWQLIIN